ncbi:MAG: glycosyltransferase family 4 protein [Hyphomicrobiaceae bacterium]
MPDEPSIQPKGRVARGTAANDGKVTRLDPWLPTVRDGYPALNVEIDRVVVISDDSIQSGGAASVALSSARLLRQRGVKVTVLTGDAGCNAELAAAGAEIAGLNARSITQGNRATAAIRGLYFAQARSFLADWIEANDTPRTIYHLHNWHKVLSPSAFVPLRKVAARLFLTAHDYFIVCPNGGYSHFPRDLPCKLIPMSSACLVTSCDKRNYAHKLWRSVRHSVRASVFDLNTMPATVIAVHEGMISHLERGGIDRDVIRVVRNPVSPWTADRVAAERNEEIFYVGRLEVDKGVDVLARVCARIDAPLTIIGDGPLGASPSLQGGRNRILGRLTPHEIAREIRRARMLVMPTRCRETFGMVAAEALMSGVPVIASDLAPITEDIVRLKIGAACNPGNEDALAAQLTKFIGDDATIATMSRRAFTDSRQLAPTSSQWCDDLISLYLWKLSRANMPV